MADNESTSVTKDLGIVSAYGYAKAAGYTGTEEEFEQIFLEFTENAPGLLDRLDDAVDAAEDAESTAVSAKNAAVDAKDAAVAAAATFETDTTLAVSGKAADAKVTGDEITGLKTAITQNTEDIDAVGNAAFESKAVYDKAVVEIDDAANGLPIALEAVIKAAFTTDGVPTKANPLTIKAYNSLSVYVAEDDTENVIDTRTVTLSGDVYGGEFTIQDGTATVKSNWRYVRITGGSSWYKSGNRFANTSYRPVPVDNQSLAENIICSHYQTLSPAGTYVGAQAGVSVNASPGYGMFISDPDFSTVDQLNTFLNSNEVYFAYKLSDDTTTTYAVDPITTTDKKDFIWCDSGNITELIYKRIRCSNKVIFFDDFDSPYLNKNVWEVGNGPNNSGNQDINYALPENVTIENSQLILTTKVEEHEGKTHTSASVKSDCGFEFGKGAEISARIKFEDFGKGVWASFWTYPDFTLANGSSSWPKYGEIDVFEYANTSTSADVTGIASVHCGADSSHVITKTGMNTGVPYNDEDWHIYAMRWDDDNIVFTVDGVKTGSVKVSDLTDTSDFNAFEYVNNRHAIQLFILYNKVGITSETPSEMKMYVDWIKCESVSSIEKTEIIQFENDTLTVQNGASFYPQVQTNYALCDKTVRYISEKESIVSHTPQRGASNKFTANSTGETRIFAINRNGKYDVCHVTVT